MHCQPLQGAQGLYLKCHHSTLTLFEVSPFNYIQTYWWYWLLSSPNICPFQGGPSLLRPVLQGAVCAPMCQVPGLYHISENQYHYLECPGSYHILF